MWFSNGLCRFVPVQPGEVEHEKYAAHRPGQGIGPADHPELVDDLQDQGHIYAPQHAPAAQHDDHGHGGLAAAPKHACRAVGQGQHAVEKGIDPGVGNAIGDGFRVADEELQQLGNENVHDNADKLCRNHGRKDAEQGNAA